FIPHVSQTIHAPYPFPTRRSSDLGASLGLDSTSRPRSPTSPVLPTNQCSRAGWEHDVPARPYCSLLSATTLCSAVKPGAIAPVRSEEHTSELQSRFDLVCRLPLEI